MLYLGKKTPSATSNTIIDQPALDDPQIMELSAYWHKKQASFDDNTLPSRNDIDPIEMRRLLGNLMIIDISDDHKKHTYRLVGMNIVEHAREDFTGQDAEQHITAKGLEGTAFRIWLRAMRQSQETAQPVFGDGLLPWRANDSIGCRWGIFPLAADGKNVDKLVICMGFSSAKDRIKQHSSGICAAPKMAQRTA